jgi:hypothetical protein
MVITGPSMQDDLASMATSQANIKVQQAISITIMKQQQDQQKIQVAALVKMINSTSLDGTGQLVNLMV